MVDIDAPRCMSMISPAATTAQSGIPSTSANNSPMIISLINSTARAGIDSGGIAAITSDTPGNTGAAKAIRIPPRISPS